jgi:hypothetical protein
LGAQLAQRSQESQPERLIDARVEAMGKGRRALEGRRTAGVDRLPAHELDGPLTRKVVAETQEKEIELVQLLHERRDIVAELVPELVFVLVCPTRASHRQEHRQCIIFGMSVASSITP